MRLEHKIQHDKLYARERKRNCFDRQENVGKNVQRVLKEISDDAFFIPHQLSLILSLSYFDRLSISLSPLSLSLFHSLLSHFYHPLSLIHSLSLYLSFIHFLSYSLLICSSFYISFVNLYFSFFQSLTNFSLNIANSFTLSLTHSLSLSLSLCCYPFWVHVSHPLKTISIESKKIRNHMYMANT